MSSYTIPEPTDFGLVDNIEGRDYLLKAWQKQVEVEFERMKVEVDRTAERYVIRTPSAEFNSRVRNLRMGGKTIQDCDVPTASPRSTADERMPRTYYPHALARADCSNAPAASRKRLRRIKALPLAVTDAD
jgi:hypothetical protein